MDSPNLGSEGGGPPLVMIDPVDDGPGVALEAGVCGMGRLPCSQASCSGVSGGVMLIPDSGREGSSNSTMGRNRAAETTDEYG
jgi:hypothetical protein